MLPNAYFNDTLVSSQEATLRMNDLGLLRGYGIFDFFLFRDRQPVFLNDYLDRFYHSAAFLRLAIGLNRDELSEAVQAVIRKNEAADGGIRLLLTGGYTEDGYSPGTGNLAILQHPYPQAARQPARGCHLMTYEHQRELPQVKSTNYLTGIYVQPLLQQCGADFVLYHQGGTISESDRSNFFLVDSNGTLRTPDTGILAGITRGKILELAQELEIPTKRSPLTLADLSTASEAFLTSSTKGVLPVLQVDGAPVGKGRTGPVTRTLRKAFRERVGLPAVHSEEV